MATTRRILLIGSAVFAAIASGSPSVAAPDPDEQIAFVRFNSLFLMNADGSDQQPFGVDGGQPDWHPSGDVVAYVQHDAENNSSEIFVTRPDAPDAIQLTDTPRWDESRPDWSPNGRRIVFDAHKPTSGEGPDVFVMRADGTRRRNLTKDHPAGGSDPVWSPDGTRIAFRDPASDCMSISVMLSTGAGRTCLRPPPLGPNQPHEEPAWSPSGTRIAFVAHTSQPGSTREIFVMRSDGTRLRNLTQSATDESDPSWSTDGGHIAFVSRDPDPDVWIMRANGSEQTNITDNEGIEEWSPTWRP